MIQILGIARIGERDLGRGRDHRRSGLSTAKPKCVVKMMNRRSALNPETQRRNGELP
jgi:hypothetical protein